MDLLNQHRHGSVTERLSARLDEIDPVVGRLLKNEAKLIADALSIAVTLDELRTRIGDECTHRLKLAQEQRAYVDYENQKLRQLQGATFNSLAEFCGRSFLQRLRWLVTGK
ncbi:MAG TPA: hypothetical protein VK595_00660 [Vicinamibacterales bacterium]|nr:hypothetical protein [Vicinamibacterales bacterium]